ncbi:MAG: ATP-binding protein [bacterium]
MLDSIKKYQVWEKEPQDVGFKREFSLRAMVPKIGNRLIKVITGQRRCGKSFLMRQIIETLIEEKMAERESILYLNMEYNAFSFIKNTHDLNELTTEFKALQKKEQKCFLFIDEVQKIEEWEKSVNSLAQDFTQEWEIFITGSNASLLSGELATLLSGRYISFTLFPFSYSEFCGITGDGQSSDSFSKFMQFGGMPESFKLPDYETTKNYINDLRDSIVLRDIVDRFQVREIRLLDQLIEFILDSIGSSFSVNKLANVITASGFKTNSITIGNYLEYLKDVFFIHEVPRFDVAGKKIITGERKFYINDPSFRYYSALIRENTPGKYLENAVLIHLLREGYSVQTGSIYGKEIDFVAKKDGAILYIQVAYLLSSEAVMLREFGNLELVKDNYPKIVVSLDPVSFGNINGIEHFRAWEWVK